MRVTTKPIRITVETLDDRIYFHAATEILFDSDNGLLVTEPPGLGNNYRNEITYPLSNLRRFIVKVPVEEEEGAGENSRARAATH